MSLLMVMKMKILVAITSWCTDSDSLQIIVQCVRDALDDKLWIFIKKGLAE